jgi:hypothetical protein
MASHPKGGGSSATSGASAQQAAATDTANRAQQATLANQIGGTVAPTGAVPKTGGLVIPTQAPGMLMGAGLNWSVPTAQKAAIQNSIASTYYPHADNSGQQRGNTAYGGNPAPGGYIARGR